MNRTNTLQWLLVAAVLLAPWLYATALSGDAEVHLCYARQAAQGCWFCFNPGEPSAGETSPGWLLLLTALFKTLPESWVPVGLKLLSVAGWYLSLAAGYLLVRRLDGPRWLPLVATAVVGLLPGSVQAGAMGMENALFTAVFLTAVAVAQLPDRVGLLLGPLLVAAAWLRPEGLVLGVALLALTWHDHAGQRLRIAASTFLLGVALLVAFHHHATGRWWPASIEARRAAAATQALHIGPLLFDPRPTLRLVAYLPLLAGAWLAARRAWRPDGDQRLRTVSLLALLAWALPTAAGSEHTARYLLPALALLGVLAADATRELVLHARGRRWLLASVAWGAVVLVAETAVRVRMPEHGKVQRLQHASGGRKTYTDRLLGRLGLPPTSRPVVALREVQLRYSLDDRVIVRSLDGRTDAGWLAFLRDGRPDHLGWLRAAKVDALLEAPDMAPAPDGWRLRDLEQVPLMESVSPRPGWTFTRLAGSVWRLQRPE